MMLSLRVLPFRQLSGGKNGFSDGVVRAGAVSVVIPRNKVEATFTRSSGAGGQNVNKVNSRAQLRLRLATADWLDDHTRARLRTLNPGAVTKEGDLLVTSQRYRTQEANLEDGMEKLRAMVLAAAQVPAVRELDTSLSDRAKVARTEDKRRRASVKASRRGSGDED